MTTRDATRIATQTALTALERETRLERPLTRRPDGTYGQLARALQDRFGWDGPMADAAIQALDTLAHAEVFERWE